MARVKLVRAFLLTGALPFLYPTHVFSFKPH